MSLPPFLISHMVAFGITLMLAQKQLHGFFESVILTNI